jgi:hypothetical protein
MNESDAVRLNRLAARLRWETSAALTLALKEDSDLTWPRRCEPVPESEAVGLPSTLLHPAAQSGQISEFRLKTA